MRTKTLLLTAAISAAGILATMAAGVTSVNVVGYINVTVPTGFSYLANQLNAADLTIGKLITTANPGTTVYTFAGNFTANTFATYYDPADPTTLVWDDATSQLKLGSGVLVYNPGAAFNVTFVGEVAQGALSTPITAGFNIVSSQVPQAGGIQSVLGYTPAPGDVVYTPAGGSPFSAHVFAPYYDPADNTTLVWDDSGEPTLAVGAAALLFSADGHAWTRSFTVN